MNRKSLRLIAGVVVLFAATVASARAATVDLTFEGIAPYPYGDGADVYIENFYNGGTSSIGTSGTNYGISFPSNALLICLNTPGTTCSNTSKGGLGDPDSLEGGLFFLSGSNTFVDVPAGFTTGFSFDYTAPDEGGSVGVYSGLDGTGTELASLTLPTTPSDCSSDYNAGFCPFYPVGVAFSGTAESINFGGVANEIVFDDVTFGSATPGPSGATPEPSSLLLFGTGLLGIAGAIRRKIRL